jgi:triphosphoribosyl-dephospho-CoA synthase
MLIFLPEPWKMLASPSPQARPLESRAESCADSGALWQAIDDACCEALKREADGWPKPGLVTPVDAGSHRDMHYLTFVASIGALRGYFSDMAEAGAHGASYPELQAIAIAAETRMLDATRGANTHRGAIFNLGLLAAAAGMRAAQPSMMECSCGSIVASRWGAAILAARRSAPASHGNAVWQRYRAGGARDEAAAGFPSVYRIGLPALRCLLARGVDEEEALIGTLMKLMATLPDTNLLWRGGEAGLRDVQDAAAAFNGDGGVLQPDWRAPLLGMHGWMVARNLSGGGSADLVAACWLAHALEPAVEEV